MAKETNLSKSCEKAKELRSKTNLSLVKFEKKYHIPASTYVKWEHGERQYPDYLLELLEFRINADLEAEGRYDAGDNICRSKLRRIREKTQANCK